jgi:hypothetical protein
MTIGGFGQREHIFMLAYVPWLCCREARHRGKAVPRAFAMLLGLIAGPFVLLKPHFFGLLIALEVWMLCRSRRFSVLLAPEFVAVVAWSLVYAGHFAVIPSAMREAFFFQVVPFVAANYDAYDCPKKRLLLSGLPPFGLLAPVLLLIALAALALNKRISLVRNQQIGMLALATLFGLADLLISTLLIEVLGRPPRGRSLSAGLCEQRLSLFCIALILVVSAMTLQALSVSRPQSGRVDEFVRLIQSYSKPGDRVAFIDTGWMLTYPAPIRSNMLTGTQYMPTFPIAMLNKNAQLSASGGFSYKSEIELGEKARYLLDDLGTDLGDYKPSLVFINAVTCCTGCPPEFNIDKYLYEAGWFSRHMKDHKPFTEIGPFTV